MDDRAMEIAALKRRVRELEHDFAIMRMCKNIYAVAHMEIEAELAAMKRQALLNAPPRSLSAS